MSQTTTELPLLALRDVACLYAAAGGGAATVAAAGLQPTSLQLARGEFCVLLGASGAGKSTLLRVLSGLVAQTAGEVLLNGEPLPAGEPRARRGRVATIHQAVDLVPRATVLDNVLHGALGTMSPGAALLGAFGDARRRHACRLLQAVGLEAQHLYRRAESLSGGQQQRVGIARAFMSDPLLVLADEPVASLDPRSSHDVLRLLRAAASEQGAAVLCSLHQTELALEFADRVIGLRAGRVVFDACPDSLSPQRVQALYADAAVQMTCAESDIDAAIDASIAVARAA